MTRLQPESLGLIFPSFATHGGGFPIWIKGVPSAPIGAIVVSGLAQNEDHQSLFSVAFTVRLNLT
jgi:uncharacterized protein (UPF0303 family)